MSAGPGVTILLLAAGASSRMRGRDKLLEEVDGRPLLRRQAEAAVATGAPVIATLPPRAPGRRAALAGLPVAVVEVPDAAEGMARSLSAGARAAGAPRGLLVVLADMPEITAEDMAALIEAFDGRTILRGAAEDGTPGHPVLFPRHLLADLAGLSGDSGAREIIREHGARPLPLPARHALTDLDTPEAWDAWRAARR